MFITDGEETVCEYEEIEGVDPYNEVKERIRAIPGLKSRFLSVGFSMNHDAVFMNKIANFGSEQGNFVFIDTYEANWR